jgi:hypothetical protein
MSLVGALTKALKAGETAKKTAPFYSAVDEALANIARPKGTGAEFLTEISKQPGVKKAELADRKLEQAFKAKGKMTKEGAQQVLKENPPPKLQERVIDDSNKLEEEELLDIVSQEMFGKPYDQLDFYGHRSKVSDEVYKRMDTENGTIYGDYKFPGGKNYREILLKLPSTRPSASNYSDPAKYDADMKAFNASGKSDYQSSHWKDDPNVLAHMRVQDRIGPNGEKILHVEEIQSDWHQAGRKKGYKNQEDYLNQKKQIQDKLNLIEPQLKAIGQSIYDFKLGNGLSMDDYRNLHKKSSELQSQRSELFDESQKLDMRTKSGIPDAPFKKNWHELAMKRLLNYAADNGYDSIALTPGAEQAKRFSLSKQIDALEWDERTGRLYAKQKNGNDFNKMADGVTSENLSDYVGKEVAEKLMSQPSTGTNRMLGGVDLEVGGEGMKGFYDQILPSYLNTFGKPYNAQISTFSIPGDRAETVERLGVAGRNLSEMTPQEVIDFNKMVDEAGAIKLHSFPITPQMREQIKQKGLPLYQQIGIPTAGAGAASQMPEQMQEPVLEPEVKKADGGAINYNTVPDMTDGERIMQGAPFKRGGKVKLTTNRDTMFLELSNKKLKRK